jgi:hypothetical protein
MHLITSLSNTLRDCMEALPDQRTGSNDQFSMADFGMAAFSLFFMQSPSFLEHQRRIEQGSGRSNCQSLFGMTKIPKDSQIRKMLDPVSPDLLFPIFKAIRERLQQSSSLLESFRRLGGHTLIALDGSEYFCSDKLGCKNCSTRRRHNGKTEHFHTMLAATLVAPGHDKVIPLEPEFITPQDGAKKQDCENRAAKRWLAAHGTRYAALNPIYLGDDLFARQPLCEAVQAVGGHFIFTCKPSSHPLILEYITGVELPSHQTTVKRGKKRVVHRYRWLCDIPLRDGEDALSVNWFEMEIGDTSGKVTYRNSFITDLPIDASNIAELADCGRARWKIENETFNVLKTKGYNLEHNFGHGKENLSAVLATLNLLAFAMHAILDVTDELWRLARQKLVTRSRFFNMIADAAALMFFPSWDELLRTVAFVRPPAPD